MFDPDKQEEHQKDLQALADKVKAEIPGLGFALLVFSADGTETRYISNTQRSVTISAMKESILRLSGESQKLLPKLRKKRKIKGSWTRSERP